MIKLFLINRNDQRKWYSGRKTKKYTINHIIASVLSKPNQLKYEFKDLHSTPTNIISKHYFDSPYNITTNCNSKQLKPINLFQEFIDSESCIEVILRSYLNRIA